MISSALQLRVVALGALIALGCNDSSEGSKPSSSADPVASSRPQSPPAPGPSASAAEAPGSAAPDAGEEHADEIVVIAGGDVNLGRGAGRKLLRNPKHNPFVRVQPWLKAADYRFVNLECPLSDQGGVVQHPTNRLIFTGPPNGADLLARVGIDLVSVANNHAWDYGKPAFFETLDNLKRVGVAYVGGAKEVGQAAYQAHVSRVKGFSIAWFAVTHIWNQGPINTHEGRHHVAWARYDWLGPVLKKAREEHDIVLVSYHGGAEYVDMPMKWKREFVRAVMYGGADALIGHHPHVPQGISWHEGKPILYSLGNLIFPMHKDHPWTGISYLARFTFRKGKKLKLEACPYHMVFHTPYPVTGKYAVKAPLPGPGNKRAAREPGEPPPEADKQKIYRERIFRSKLSSMSKMVGGSVLAKETTADGCIEITPPERRIPIY